MNAIALVMIVRDESRCLRRCLDSARPWVDEIVVLDTGSTDDTVAIARDAGARVAHFAWVDDFAAARNAALALTDARWRLVLDADEWIVAGGDELRRWRDAAPECIGQIVVSSVFDDARAARAEAPSWLPRLLPRGVRYEGRVHEQPVSALPRRRLGLRVAHDGYLPQPMQAKLGRNERLLLLALQQRPGDAYLQYQLGKELEVRGRYNEALPLYRRAWDACGAQAAWRHDLLLRLLFTLKCTRGFEVALDLAAAQMPHWPHSPDFFFTLGDVLLQWAVDEPARGPELLPMIESAWLRALEIGEQPALHDSVRGRGSFLAAHNLAVLHASLGDAEAARAWREREAALRAAASAADDGV